MGYAVQVWHDVSADVEGSNDSAKGKLCNIIDSILHFHLYYIGIFI